MKKWILAVLILVVLAVGLLYLLIPNTIRVQQSSVIAVNSRGFSRVFLDEKKWAGWWPGETLAPNGKGYGSFTFNKQTYSIIEKKLSSTTILIGKGSESFVTELLFIPLGADSMAINWSGQHASPSSPEARLEFYYKAKAINKDLQTILQKMKDFYSNEASVYGLAIQKTYVADSALISTSATAKSYPSVKDIYALIDHLYAFAQKNGAKQTAPPMLNVTSTDSVTYTTRVALPVDKKLKDEGAIQYRWMMGGGRILAAEVKGGPHSINNVFAEMQNYITDFHRTAPAIPFQSLVTDRSKEPDTAKWVTKVYWPVM